jgi:hypothetical protein
MTIKLWRDKEWEPFAGHLCRVSSFHPWASVVDGKVTARTKVMPYAVIEIDEINSQKLPEPVTGYITHSMDFAHLWQVFEVRGVQEDEVVAIFWTKQNYRSKIHKLFSSGMPKLIVWVWRKRATDCGITLISRTIQQGRDSETQDPPWN